MLFAMNLMFGEKWQFGFSGGNYKNGFSSSLWKVPNELLLWLENWNPVLHPNSNSSSNFSSFCIFNQTVLKTNSINYFSKLDCEHEAEEA